MSAGARNAFVTGAAGFVGSNLVDRLLADGWAVTGWDNFSTGQDRFLAGASRHPSFRLVRGDTLDLPALAAAMAGAAVVFHLAANADIRDGWRHPERDLQQNTVATFNVLEAMRTGGVRRIAFASTGSVYGDARVTPDAPTPEMAPFPVQTSLYAASKVAGEGLVSAYAEGGHLDEAYVFRCWANATATAMSSTFIVSSSPTRRGCACSATAASARATCTCTTASRPCCTCSPRTRRRTRRTGRRSTTSARRSTSRSTEAWLRSAGPWA
jgi:UDP-glucose 4-epimerase